MPNKVMEFEGKRYHAMCLEDSETRAATAAHGFDDDEMCARCEDPLGEEDELDDDDDEEED